MHQEINLYRSFESPRPSASILNWKRFWGLNGAFIILLFLYYLILSWHLHRLHTEKNNLQIASKSTQANFFALKKEYPQIFFSQEANVSIQQLQQALVSQEKILNLISNQIPLSNYFVTLSNVIAPNVWLSKIIISESGLQMTMRGKSIGKENLQRFLMRLTKANIFSGYTLMVNNIENPSKSEMNEILLFEVSIAKKT